MIPVPSLPQWLYAIPWLSGTIGPRVHSPWPTATDEDKNGFMMAVHGLDRSKGLDLIIHTPGGSLSATHSIINYLHSMFGSDIRAVIPQIAMSAGTIMACACKSILMGLHSNLGPIDPHINNVSTYAVLDEFKKAYKQIKNDPAMINVWRPILEQYRPTFLSQCEYAKDWTKNLVTNELMNNMFQGDPNAATIAADAAKELSNHTDGHSKHIHMQECINIGLKIEQLEAKGNEKLQDLILTVHHCYMNTIMNTSAYKLIENQNGAAFVKHQGTLIKQ